MSRVYSSFVESITLNLQCPTTILLGVYSSFTLQSDLPTRGSYLVADNYNKTVEYSGGGSFSWRSLDLLDTVEEDTIAFRNYLRELLDSLPFEGFLHSSPLFSPPYVNSYLSRKSSSLASALTR